VLLAPHDLARGAGTGRGAKEARPRAAGGRSPRQEACHVFFPWYNTEHHHSSLGLLTPSDVHHGLAEQRVAARATVLATAYAAHPERFPAGLPQPPARPEAVWINPPKSSATEGTRGLAATRGGVLDHARPGQVFSAHRSDLDRRGCVETPA